MQIAFSGGLSDNPGMAKRPTKSGKHGSRTKPTRPQKPAKSRVQAAGPHEQLQLGQWLAALDLQQIDVAKDAKIGRAYMNNLINPKNPEKPPKPSALVMLRVSRAMGVSVNDLYAPPPTKAEIARLRSYQSTTLGSLMAAGG